MSAKGEKPDRAKTIEELDAEMQAIIDAGPEWEDPPPQPEPPPADVVPLDAWGRKPWTAEPTRVTSYKAYAPTSADRIAELQQAVADAARSARRAADPFGVGLYGERESIEDVVRRQDRDR